MKDDNLDDLITPAHRREMIDYINSLMQQFKTTSVKESLVDFTENTRVLTAGVSARPGPYRFEVVPYMREITECLSDYSRITEVCLMKGTQVAGTEMLINQQLYCIKHGIGPAMYVSSDDNLAQEFFEKRTDTAIAAAGLQDLITPAVQKKANKSSGDSRRAKSYQGTHIRATGSRSESKLSSFAIRVLQMDEVDKYPAALAGGGSSIEAATRRCDSYGNLKKIVYISTPKSKATSRIEPLFKTGDMRYYFVPCPKCGFMQRLVWAQMIWEKTADGKINIQLDENGNLKNNPIWHKCVDCGYKMRDYEKFEFMKERNHGGRAEWRATKQTERPGMRSYHVSSLYGFRSWLSLALQFCEIEGDQDLLQSFVNNALGESFEARIDKPDQHYLASRAETDFSRGDINQNIKILTCGVDVQENRLIMSLLGWTNRKESWMIEYYIFEGETINADSDCFNALEETLSKGFYKSDGSEIFISICLMDAAYHTEAVMNFCERFIREDNKNAAQGVFPCFGKLVLSQVVREHESTIRTPEILLDDQRLKREIYTNLKRKMPAAGHNFQPGYVHFPCDFSEDFYAELTAEEVTESSNSKGVVSIMISNTKQRANHALDAHKMALGGLYYMYFKHFELWNADRKLKRWKPIPPDWEIFWGQCAEHKKKEVEKIKI